MARESHTPRQPLPSVICTFRPAFLAPPSPVADRGGVPDDMKSRFHGASAYWKRSFMAQIQRAETGINYVDRGKTGRL
jgi:hypothetical protein